MPQCQDGRGKGEAGCRLAVGGGSKVHRVAPSETAAPLIRRFFLSDVEKSGGVDLFGDPIIVRNAKRGRPEHERTERNANKVSLLFAMGYEVKDVAAALGITQPTLRKHYFSEVQQRDAMRLKLEAEQLSNLFDSAKDGNVGAMKKLLDRVDRGGLVALSKSVTKRKTPDEVKPKAPLGKKQERQLDAERASEGGLYATRQGPPAVH